MRRAIRQDLQYSKCKKNRRKGFKQEQPLPAVKSKGSVEPKNDARKRSANDIGQWNGGREACREARPIRPREPKREVEHHARKKSGLSHTQEETQEVKAQRPLHECACGREQTPCCQDVKDAATRADACNHHRGGHVKKKIPD